MPTIDELASQVAALEQQMAAITTPPDKYYTSIYSGEEIDAAITKVRSGAMGVSSFNGRAGAVMPQAGDYNAAQIPVSADAGAETVAAALNNKANRNLLDNWYFGNPVNQRGQTSYNTLGYSIDRWTLKYGTVLELNSGGIQISRDSESSEEIIVQVLPKSDWVQIAGMPITLSALINEKLASVSFTAPINLDELIDSPDIFVDGLYADVYGTPNNNSCGVRFFSVESGTWTIQAVKLELGSQQTLAHQDENGNWVLNEIPDYGEELAKCQRYLIPMDANSCWGLAESNTSAYLYLPLPVSMRTTPVFQGNIPPILWPGGNSVTSISVFSPSAIESMIALHVVGTGFIAQNCYSLNQPIGFLSAEL